MPLKSSQGVESEQELHYFWVIGGGHLQIPLIREIHSLGLQSICTDKDGSCPASAVADKFFKIDIFDIQSHLSLATKLKSSGISIVGVLAAGIDAPQTMAEIASHLRIPGVTPAIASLVNNKIHFREMMKELGEPVPRFVAVDEKNRHQAVSLANSVGYPLIVKNSDSSGSRGTTIMRKPNDEALLSAIDSAIHVSRSKAALIESLWEGPEQTVETIFDVNGRFHPCFITDRYFDNADGFALEVGLRHPSILAESVQVEMYQTAERVARSVGVNIGAAKFDFLLTADGPRIIEMTVRLSGGFDAQYLVPSATGKNVLKAAVLTALGQNFDPALLTDAKGCVALSGSIWPKPGLITEIQGVNEALSIPGVDRVIMRARVGQQISEYKDCAARPCFIVTSGRTEKTARAALLAAQETIVIRTRQG